MTGFSLLELLFIIGITLLLAATTIPIYGGLQVSSQLNETTSQIIQTIRIAKERSVARINDSAHGVFLDTANKKYTLYQGFAWPGTIIREEILASAFSLSTTQADINFSKGLGIPNILATVTITLTHAASGSRQITINSFGAVEKQ